jgi:hypothetical protein
MDVDLSKSGLKDASVQNRPFLATTLSFLSSRPGFPATLRWTLLRVRLSRKERRMKFVVGR